MEKRISFLVVPNFSDKMFNKTFSYRVVKIFSIGIFIFIVMLVFMFLYSLKFYSKLEELAYLKQRNKKLEEEVSKIKIIKTELANLEKDRKKIFIMLGLEKTPELEDFTKKVFNYDQPISLISDSALIDSGKVEDKDELFYPQTTPTLGFFVTRGFSMNHPGIDFATSEGKPVFTIEEGVVEKVGYDSIYGNFILIAHANNYKSFYAHLQKIIVNKGDSVLAKDIIGYVGSTGKATAPHLHFELWHKNTPVDPADYFVLKRIKIR